MAKIETKSKKCDQCGEIRKIPVNRKKCYACRDMNQKILERKILTPDYAETTVDKYKEPMEKVKGGYGYLGAITETKDGKFIQCHICGYFFEKLGAHVKRHKIAPREYKIKFGLRVHDGLMSPIAREEAQIRYNRDTRGKENQKKATAAAMEKRKRKNWKTGGNQWNPQTRNERGNCKEQTLAKIRKLAEMYDGVARFNDYTREFGDPGTVQYWFGSWQKAVKAAGLETYYARMRRMAKKNKKDALKQMQAFYKKHGRTPQSSDFNSDDDLPAHTAMTRWYGTLNNARIAANIPVLAFVPGKGWEEQSIEEYIKKLDKL